MCLNDTNREESVAMLLPELPVTFLRTSKSALNGTVVDW